MKLQDITSKYQELNIYEERNRSDDYEELVFYKKEIDEWERIFTDMLGPAKKPAGSKPTKEDKKITEDHGGIQQGQTLFMKELEDATILAMFWPWSDNTYCTLRVMYIRK